MSPVKRNYDSSRRRQQADENRRRVLDAARARFLRDGYRATTMAQIAEDADVSPQTVAKQFGNKSGLVRALFEVALVGDDAGGALEDRDFIVAIHQEPDPRRKLERYAAALATMLPRTAPIQLLLRDAGADSELAPVWAAIRTGRLAGMTNLAENLREGGHLGSDVTVERARDILWATSSPDLYQLLVMERGWTTDDYAGSSATRPPRAAAGPRATRSRLSEPVNPAEPGQFRPGESSRPRRSTVTVGRAGPRRCRSRCRWRRWG